MENYDINNMTKQEIPNLDDIKKVIDYALTKHDISECYFSVIFVDNDYIREINKSYRDKDYVTDVISFAFLDDADDFQVDTKILGDIYVCIDKAYEQANEYNHSIKREITFLVLHGLLHLLGYDHIEKNDEIKMFEMQEVILDEYEKV